MYNLWYTIIWKLERISMSIYVLFGLILTLIIGGKILNKLVDKGRLDNQSSLYKVIDGFLSYTPQVYGLLLFTHWITDTGSDWLIVTICYAMMLILWTVYGKLFFEKKFESITAIIISLLTLLLLVIATAKSLYMISFGVFMTYYLVLVFRSKRGKKYFAKSIGIYIVIISLVVLIGINLDLEDDIKPVLVAKDYISIHHEKNTDDRYIVHPSIFDLHEPLYIMVWKKSEAEKREFIELLYYRGQIYEKTTGSVNDLVKEILDKEKN